MLCVSKFRMTNNKNTNWASWTKNVFVLVRTRNADISLKIYKMIFVGIRAGIKNVSVFLIITDYSYYRYTLDIIYYRYSLLNLSRRFIIFTHFFLSSTNLSPRGTRIKTTISKKTESTNFSVSLLDCKRITSLLEGKIPRSVNDHNLFEPWITKFFCRCVDDEKRIHI